MANKAKVSGNNKVKSNGDSNSGSGSGSGSGSSNIFETLFGDAPEQKGSVSIFSADNPFRRKSSDHAQTPHHHQQQQHQKQQVGLGFSSAEAVRNTTTGDNEIPNPAEVTKRKRNKEKNSNLDSGSLDDPSKTPLETKNSRKFEPKSSNLGVNYGERGGGQSSDLGFDSKGSLKRGKGRKHNLSPESKESLESGNGKEPNLRLATDELPKQKEGKNLELNGTLTLEKKEAEKKKKRKRDEVEAEYEARHYGVVATNVEGGEGGLGRKLVGEKRKKLDDPVDMMVSKEGFDNEAKLLRTVFVGNLPLKVKKKALFKDFRQFGEVESVRIRSVPLGNTKRPRKGAIIQKEINGAVDSVHAYVVFKTEEAAQASLAYNMAVVGGNHIRVDRACPPRKKLKGEDAPLYDNKRTLFVGNLPFDVKDEEIYQLFSGIKDLESSIEGIRVIRDPGTSMGKGIAYILFKTRGAANLLAKKRSLKLRDRELRLSHSRSNATPSNKRKSPSPWERNESPSKKLKADPKTPVSDSKVKLKADSSYQGLRASKSGVQKKVSTRVIHPVKLTTGTPKGEKLKERNGKRPSVAARKANALNGGGSSKQNGKKRKMESRTPESARPNKKIRKFR